MESCRGHPPLALLPPTFLPFSPSSPSPSPSGYSIVCPGPPTTFLLLSVTDGDVSPAGALAAPAGKPNAWACPGWLCCLLGARQATACALGRTLARVPSRQGPSRGCPWHGDGSGSARAGCVFSGMLTSFAFPGITGIPVGAAVLRALFLPLWTKGQWDASPAWDTSPRAGCLHRGAGRVPILSHRWLPSTHRPPSGADSERKQKLLGVLGGGGGEAKQNQAGYFKPDLNSPLSLLSPALATPPPSAAPLLRSFPGERAALLAPPRPRFL